MGLRWRRSGSRLGQLGVVAASLCLALVGFAARGDDAVSEETLVTFRYRSGELTSEVSGRVLVTAADGGLLVEGRDGRLVTIRPADLLGRETLEAPFTPASAEELAAGLQQELGPAFTTLTTRRYVIATNAGREYAAWCGKLFERLQTAYFAYWKRDALELHEPRQPLCAIIFADPREYAAYATADAGPAVAQTQGYYSVRTNRIILTDLTRDASGTARSEAEIERRLEARIANLTTVVHEATHQIAFNSGLHTRYADNPMWVTEGMAMFFEAPDLRTASGWRTIGKVHPGRLEQFRDYVARRRQPGSLATLLASEERFRDPATMADAYAESWALTYYLVRERRKEYAAYLVHLAGKPRLIWDTPEKRLQEFEAALGVSLQEVEEGFLKYMAKVRATAR